MYIANFHNNTDAPLGWVTVLVVRVSLFHDRKTVCGNTKTHRKATEKKIRNSVPKERTKCAAGGGQVDWAFVTWTYKFEY